MMTSSRMPNIAVIVTVVCCAVVAPLLSAHQTVLKPRVHSTNGKLQRSLVFKSVNQNQQIHLEDTYALDGLGDYSGFYSEIDPRIPTAVPGQVRILPGVDAHGDDKAALKLSAVLASSLSDAGCIDCSSQEKMLHSRDGHARKVFKSQVVKKQEVTKKFSSKKKVFKADVTTSRGGVRDYEDEDDDDGGDDFDSGNDEEVVNEDAEDEDETVNEDVEDEEETVNEDAEDEDDTVNEDAEDEEETVNEDADDEDETVKEESEEDEETVESISGDPDSSRCDDNNDTRSAEGTADDTADDFFNDDTADGFFDDTADGFFDDTSEGNLDTDSEFTSEGSSERTKECLVKNMDLTAENRRDRDARLARRGPIIVGATSLGNGRPASSGMNSWDRGMAHDGDGQASYSDEVGTHGQATSTGAAESNHKEAPGLSYGGNAAGYGADGVSSYAKKSSFLPAIAMRRLGRTRNLQNTKKNERQQRSHTFRKLSSREALKVPIGRILDRAEREQGVSIRRQGRRMLSTAGSTMTSRRASVKTRQGRLLKIHDDENNSEQENGQTRQGRALSSPDVITSSRMQGSQQILRQALTDEPALDQSITRQTSRQWRTFVPSQRHPREAFVVIPSEKENSKTVKIRKVRIP